jgi:hypothetical protein
MKAVLSTSIACSAVSLLGLLGLSVMTVAPSAEGWRLGLMLLAGVLLVAWLRLAFWARARLRSSVADLGVSQRLKTVVVVGGVVYILFVLLCSLG